MSPILAAAIICLSPQIHDGDTLHCAGQTIRLYGINAPEVPPRQLEPGGNEAKSALIRLTQNQTVTCKPTGGHSYRRVVARCFVNGRDVAVLLLGDALVCRWAKFDRQRIYAGIGRDCGPKGKQP